MPAREEVAGRELGRPARGEAEEDEPAAGAEELQGAAAERAADAVEGHRDRAPAERRAHRVAPIGRRVVDGDRRPELGHALHLGRAAGDADHGRAGVARRLHEQAAQAARGGGDEDDVVRRQGGDLEDREGRAPGADHRHRGVVGQAVGQRVQGLGLADGQLGVAAARRPQVGDHPPAHPALVDLGTDGVDHARDLAARDRRQLGERERAHGPAGAQRGVDQVHAAGRHGDARLPRPGPGIVDLLVAQVRGRSEGVQADGVHDGHATRARVRPPRAIGPRTLGAATRSCSPSRSGATRTSAATRDRARARSRSAASCRRGARVSNESSPPGPFALRARDHGPRPRGRASARARTRRRARRRC